MPSALNEPAADTRPARVTPARGWLRGLAIKIVRMILVGVLFGWAYAWAAPTVYPRDGNPGFWLGSAHGALMPMALPSLLMGNDVPIYAPKNQGRIYKVGYILGINGCGFFFFGLSFWQPNRSRSRVAGSGPGPKPG